MYASGNLSDQLVLDGMRGWHLQLYIVVYTLSCSGRSGVGFLVGNMSD